MTARVKKRHPALKHAGYSGLAFFPARIRSNLKNCIKN